MISVVWRFRVHVGTLRDVKAILPFSSAVIYRLFDTGEIKGWRVPGSNHRRFDLDSARAFAERHGIRAGATCPPKSEASERLASHFVIASNGRYELGVALRENEWVCFASALDDDAIDLFELRLAGQSCTSRDRAIRLAATLLQEMAPRYGELRWKLTDQQRRPLLSVDR